MFIYSAKFFFTNNSVAVRPENMAVKTKLYARFETIQMILKWRGHNRKDARYRRIPERVLNAISAQQEASEKLDRCAPGLSNAAESRAAQNPPN